MIGFIIELFPITFGEKLRSSILKQSDKQFEVNFLREADKTIEIKTENYKLVAQ